MSRFARARRSNESAAPLHAVGRRPRAARSWRRRRAGIFILLALTGAVAGCSTDSYRWKMGVQWVQEAEAEKRALNAAGFPQYNAGW